MSNGMGGKGGGRYRGPPPRRGRPFHPEDRCYECGERGHYARDCYRYRGSRGGGRRRYACCISIVFIFFRKLLSLTVQYYFIF